MKGIYKHYKGGIYSVIGEGIHTETNEVLVFYTDENGDFWARPTEMFKSTIEVDGKVVNRFDKI